MRFILDAFKSALRSAKHYRMSDIAELKMGRQKAPKYTKGVGLRPYLSVANVGKLELVLGSVGKMDFTDMEFKRFRLIPGDILITEGDLISRFNVGRAAVFKGEIPDCCFQNTLIRLRPRKGLDVDYALLMLEGARLSGVFARAAKTTTVTHLGLHRLSVYRTRFLGHTFKLGRLVSVLYLPCARANKAASNCEQQHERNYCPSSH